MNIKTALSEAKAVLKEGKVAEPQASAEVLLCDVLGISRTTLAASPEKELNAAEFKKYHVHVQKRLNHEPVWQIIGKVDFWGLSYTVTKDVMVPRPETEILVQKAVAWAKSQERALKALDLGTGSGTIIIALATELQNCSFFASDVSAAALQIARKNAAELLPSGKVELKEGDLFEPWQGKKFDLITANLPYIPSADMQGLALDVYHYEPRVALEGGQDGLAIYERFFAELQFHLNKNGAIFCEIGIHQGEAVKQLVRKYLPDAKCEVLGDLAGIDRVVIIKT